MWVKVSHRAGMTHCWRSLRVPNLLNQIFTFKILQSALQVQVFNKFKTPFPHSFSLSIHFWSYLPGFEHIGRSDASVERDDVSLINRIIELTNSTTMSGEIMTPLFLTKAAPYSNDLFSVLKEWSVCVDKRLILVTEQDIKKNYLFT